MNHSYQANEERDLGAAATLRENYVKSLPSDLGGRKHLGGDPSQQHEQRPKDQGPLLVERLLAPLDVLTNPLRLAEQQLPVDVRFIH